MKLRPLVLFSAVVLGAASGHAQSATLAADKSAAAAGSDLTLTASAIYDGTPSAMGWSVALPDGWSFVSSTGPNLPAIGPASGATGTLEWAYTDAPAGVAQFRFTVKVAGKAGDAQLQAKLLVRAGGKQQAAEARPLTVAVIP